jgi:hypothetical protein
MNNQIKLKNRHSNGLTKTNFLSLHNFLFILILLVAGITYVYWSYHIIYNNAPDEEMRYLLPLYIYHHGNLPSGFDHEVKYAIGNWSYAFYPQMLGALVSSFFMKIMSFVRQSDHALLFAARMASVFFGLVTTYFVGKSLRRITTHPAIPLLGMVLLAFLPQFTFLSSYVNNDIIAVAGSSVIIYSMIWGAQDQWNKRNTALLATGFIICSLGYLNSYGFILIGGAFFVLSNIRNISLKNTTIKKSVLLFIELFIVTAIFVFPFLIRNFVLYHDIFGMNVFHKEYIKWVAVHGQELQHPYDGTINSLLVHEGFRVTTFRSFVGLFGFMNVQMSQGFYQFFGWIFKVGLAGVLIDFIYNMKKKIANKIYPKHFIHDTITRRIFYVCVFIGCLITLAFLFYYSYAIDFQPQGRYIMAILPAMIMFITIGFRNVLDFFVLPNKKTFLVIILIIIYIFINILVYKNWVSLPRVV